MALPERDAAAPMGSIIESGGKDNVSPSKSNLAGNSPQARWRDAHPLERWSHVAVASAIRRGILVRPTCCENCGEEKLLDAHHEDHRRPLDVKFWCRACHARHHARLRKGGAA
ncbi:hypothetical protein [Mesorhizobium sp.]|uniref:hypothetical protein n=1 Tax=Mesorhizobium sp. TaxID=1871066 RepID=UPI00120E1E65|nr:hypothetical protein [Mesorhizobium sp.]TIQ11013.1 MAG: hypothetical protein E5X50_09495 [Mesorhizobium sp.]